MSGYKYGAYGEIVDSRTVSPIITATNVVYFGLSPTNLVRDYKEKDLVNRPIRLHNWSNAQQTLGYTDNWDTFNLCEAMDVHFNNPVQNAGPIYTVNILDPDVHRANLEEKSEEITLIEPSFKLEVYGITKGSLVLIGYIENTDYLLTYEEEFVEIVRLNDEITTVNITYTVGGLKKESITFNNGKAFFINASIILDTLGLENMVEGLDYNLDYNYTKKEVIVTHLINETFTGNVDISYAEIDTSKITKEDIIGGVSAEGVYSGLSALSLLYQNTNQVANILVAPGYSEIPDVYKAMVAISQKINGHWDAFVIADIPIIDKAGKPIDTKEKAIKWKKENNYISERCKPCYPMTRNVDKIYHTSTLTAWRMQLVDYANANLPFETPANKELPITSPYFGEYSNNKGYDQTLSNDLTREGITTMTYFGGRWVLWGDHTGNYSFGKDMDARGIFDSNMRMLMHISNGFQLRNAIKIDKSMTIQRRDSILNEEQEILDSYKQRGALIGEPTISFEESENSTPQMLQGHFYFDTQATVTPPLKAAMLRVAYTDEGFSSYFGGDN